MPRAGCGRWAGGLWPALAMLGALVLLSGVTATTAQDGPRAFLTQSFGLTDADFTLIDRGEVVTGHLTAADKREVATFGVVRMAVTPEFYIEQYADIAEMKKTDAVLQIGQFSAPPTLNDVAGLTLDDADAKSLRGCRVGKCGVQLSAQAITRFRQEVDWAKPNAMESANRLMRAIVVEYATEYSRSGAAAVEYADQPEPMNMGKEFALLSKSTIGGWREFPALQQHLLQYPKTETPNVDDVLYWSKEVVGRRTVTSVTHVAISRTAAGSAAEYAIASKQIYGSHYFDASLGLTVLFRAQSAPLPATYLAYVNRSRIDMFTGMLGGVTRRIVTSRARSTVADQLTRIKGKLETRFAANKTSQAAQSRE